MGPLAPDIISDELNYVIALFLGFAFGFVLEQAGFSTSKKLVGLFYGYDFTVLRVFFTGGVTAMVGVVALSSFGLLDTSLILVNPTFLWSAIVGGLIMGLGFVIGGYCPGTSLAGAAIGKIDAMIFVGGSVLGVYAFAEGYPLWEGLYKANNWGGVRLMDTFGGSQSLWAFIWVVMALGAFWAVRLVENKVNGVKDFKFTSNKRYLGLTGLSLLIGLSAFLMTDKKESIMTNANSVDLTKEQIKVMDSDELAFRIMDKDINVFIYDLRPQKEYTASPLPNSVHITLNNLFEKDFRKMLSVKDRKNIFIANNDSLESKAAFIAIQQGYDNSYILKGGFDQFKKDIIDFTKPAEVKTQQEIDTYRFRESAKAVIPALIKEFISKNSAPAKTGPKRELKGC